MLLRLSIHNFESLTLVSEIWCTLPNWRNLDIVVKCILIGKHGNTCRVQRVVPIEWLPRSFAISTRFSIRRRVVVYLAIWDQVRFQLLHVLRWCALNLHRCTRWWFASNWSGLVGWFGGLLVGPLNWRWGIPLKLREHTFAILSRVQSRLSSWRHLS